MTVESVTIVGLGLIGGSVAAAARRSGDVRRIRAVDPDPAARSYAVEQGLADEALATEEAVSAGWFSDDSTELLVLGTPVEATTEWLRRLGELGYHGIVTDVSSTKGTVVEVAREVAAEARHAGVEPYRFVGGHPMTGSERSGVKAARETLFDGAYYLLVATDDTDMDAYREVHAFVTSLGARVISVDAAVHDQAVAIVSHVPHVAAAALVSLASSQAQKADADLLRLAAGGFKDMTRIASGSPDLWTGICMDNAEALTVALDDLLEVLGGFRRAVVARDAGAIHSWLAKAAEVRRALPAQWVPATAELLELTVPVSDRPGVVSIVTTALGRAGCNIEDIEIDHRSEDTAVLHLVLTDEGDFEGMLADLEGHGFAPVLRPLGEPEA